MKQPWIGMVGEYPPILQDLNYVRDAFSTAAPYPMIVCLPDGALTRLAKFAPDFWAWRMATFRFQTAATTAEAARQQTLESGQILGSLDKEKRRERVDLLLRLLADHEKAKESKTQIEILTALGELYRELGDVRQADEVLKRAVMLASWNLDYGLQKAQASYHLGWLRENQGQMDEAVQLYETAIQLLDQLENWQGKATALHNLAIIYANQGQVNEAIALHQQSLALDEQIGDVQGKASSLSWLGHIAQQQGDFETTIAHLQESLQILQRIGSPHAATVENFLANVRGALRSPL